jgi:hypothetical protein
MARIELRHCDVKIRDGLAGTAAINDAMGAMAGDTSLTIDSVVLNTDVTSRVPIGARFKVAGETNSDTIHVVTGRTPSDTGPTTAITFTPALGAGTYSDDGVITFSPQEISIKVGDGDVSYTETDEYLYDLDRGDLDTVRKGNEVPMSVAFNFTYEHITTGTGETIAPMDAIKRRGAASEWVSSSSDKCEPYAVDIVVEHTPPCGTAQKEITVFPDFRSETREPNFRDSNIAINGRCNATEPIVTRE